ncbi:hypothetical protein [Amycolatopsis sp. Hca4]|uniref:hypothetical protein n=1 Tax=Amycolatopsis sp. Hca4 TaxID=2742131 RepID=UPI00158FE39E|nr:hypothetical protein [Amycolatopsis sp. Hca4]QKV72401.1 hypothetical protein HUT10_30965 [Amycolatopsis sp. Hca4]
MPDLDTALSAIDAAIADPDSGTRMVCGHCGVAPDHPPTTSHRDCQSILGITWRALDFKGGEPSIVVAALEKRRQAPSCGTQLVDLDVHPRVIMRILRHAKALEGEPG